MTATITLIHPRLQYRRQGAYLQNSLLMLKEQLRSMFSVRLIDEVIEPLHERTEDIDASDAWGITCMGSSSIPEAIRVGCMLRARSAYKPLLVGGQVISRLSPSHFARIFRSVPGVRQIRSHADLETWAGGIVPSIFEVSMSRAIEELPERYARAYFGKEFCIFTSQGCAFNCHFCAAEKAKKEQFRNPNVFREEVHTIARMVRRFAGSGASYEAYLSTLDGAQTPDEMERCLGAIYDAQRTNGTAFGLRTLATAKCVERAANKDLDVFRRWRSYGLTCVGIGVDGNDEASWARENKRHNTEGTIAEAFSVLKEADIRPEGLMIIGLPGDSPQQIASATRACFRMSRAGIVPRPYLGKGHPPGSHAWDAGGSIVEAAVQHPNFFRDWEYAAFASPATHPDRVQAFFANIGYLVASIGCKFMPMGCPTKPLLATETGPLPLRMLGKLVNRFANEDR